MIGLGIGVTRLEASVRIETLFRAESRLIRDYAWLEEHVGSLVPIEVVTRFDPSSDLGPQQQLDTLGDLERRLREVPRVDAVVSSLIFPPSGPFVTGEQLAAGELARRQLAVAGAAGEQLNLLVRDADGGQKWRTTAYVSALGQNDYVEIMQELRSALPRHVSVAPGEPHAFPLDVQVSGLMPLVHDIQQQLLRDLFSSFLTAFGLIAVVMTLVQAGILSGLLSMIPNVFPALALFGVLGWLGRPLDIGSIMTASVAMGIAVDDTLHFLTFYQREIDSGRSRIGAVQSSYRQRRFHSTRILLSVTPASHVDRRREPRDVPPVEVVFRSAKSRKPQYFAERL
jgi:hypothetical protein